MKATLSRLVLALVLAGMPGAPPRAGAEGVVLELSTDMLRFDQPSTRLFLGWHRDVNALFRAALDGSADLLDLRGPDRALERLGLLAAAAGVDAVASRAFSITAHDQAHMEAALAIGATRAYLVRADNPSVEMGIGQFLLEAFNPASEPGLYTYTYPPASTPTPAQEAYVAQEGLDTNLAIAVSIAEGIDRGQGHVMDLAPYLLNKLWGVSYFLETGPTSDAAQYLDLLSQEGFRVSAESVIALQAACFAASGGFLALARGAAGFVSDGSSSAAPLALRVGDAEILWPEATAWLNPDNVSVLVTARVRWNASADSWAGVDAPVLGAARGPEITLGSSAALGPLRLEAQLTAGSPGFPFLKGAAELAVGERAWIGLEAFYGQGATMRELRECPAGPGAAAFIRARL